MSEGLYPLVGLLTTGVYLAIGGGLVAGLGHRVSGGEPVVVLAWPLLVFVLIGMGVASLVRRVVRWVE